MEAKRGGFVHLKILGSSSLGNSYILTDNTGQSLLIEAGISLQDVKKSLNFNISNVVGVVVSHSHL